MNQTEKEKLILALMATAEVMGNEIKPNVALVMVDDLSTYQLSDVLQALTRVRRECTGKLTLKMILDILAPAGGWISANEAWAIALPAADEAATVVWTQEMAKAFEVARPILEGGDKIGARMAFIPAYERFVDQAKRENRAPAYEISAGWDANMRELAVRNAQTAGLLPAPKQETKALAAPKKPILFDGHVAAYQQYQISQMPEERQKLFDTSIPIPERMAMLSQYLAAGPDRDWKERVQQQKHAQTLHEQRKQEMINQLQNHQGEPHAQ